MSVGCRARSVFGQKLIERRPVDVAADVRARSQHRLRVRLQVGAKPPIEGNAEAPLWVA